MLEDKYMRKYGKCFACVIGWDINDGHCECPRKIENIDQALNELFTQTDKKDSRKTTKGRCDIESKIKN